MAQTTTLIFDLDGTLVDCKELHRDGFRWAVLQQVPGAEYLDEEVEGLPTTEKIKILQAKGIKIDIEVDTLKKHFTRLNLTKYVTYNQRLFDEIERLSGVYKLCIASNSRSEFLFRCMNILNLWHFECVFSRDYCLPKPDPAMYYECMRITNSTPRTTVIFEDSLVGISAAAKTGASVVEVVNSSHLLDILAIY